MRRLRQRAIIPTARSHTVLKKGYHRIDSIPDTTQISSGTTPRLTVIALQHITTPTATTTKIRPATFMTTRPSTAPPALLTELIHNCQYLSAALPPDAWDDSLPPPGIQRRGCGTLALREVRTRRVVSAPAGMLRKRFYQREGKSGGAEAGARNMAGSSSSREKKEMDLWPATSLPRTPQVSPPISPRDDTVPARPIPRTPSSPSREYLLSPASRSFANSNGVHQPSPLRNVSMPGRDDSDIELVPRGLPRAVHELPGAKEDESKGWWGCRWEWGCCRRRK